jgi:Nucleotidyltransferase of unknown function (DUF6036)
VPEPLSPLADALGRPVANPRPILHALDRHDVDYLLVGGLAVIAHGYVRATADVDILPAPDQANMRRLAAALEALEATAVGPRGESLGLDLSHPESLAVGNYFLVTQHGALDLVNGPRPDLKRYRVLAAQAVDAHLAGVSARVIGKDDLIATKREAGREKDLRDIAALTEVERHGGDR